MTTPTRRWTRRAASAAIAAVAALILSACAPAAGGSSADEDKTLTIGVPRLFGFSNILWARDYQVDGFDFEYVYFPNFGDMLTALNAGEIDATEMGDVGVVQSYINGGGAVQAVAVTQSAPTAQGLLVKKDSGIDSLEDLKGKRVNINPSTNTYPAFLNLLASVGLTEDDVELLNPSDSYQAFIKGDLDVYNSIDPNLAYVAEETDAKLLTSYDGFFDNFYPYVVRTDAIENKRAAVEAFVQAIADNIRWAQENPQEYAELVSPKLGFSPSSLTTALDRGAKGLAPIDESFYEVEQKWVDTWAEDYGILTETVDVHDVFRDDFNPHITPGD